MEWPRLKTIIILMLVITNLCLAGLTVGQEVQSAQQARHARETAVLWVQDQDIALDGDVVPHSNDLAVRRGQRDVQREAQIAEALLPGARQEELGAQVYRYSAAGGTIQFHSSGEFRATFAPGVISCGEDAPADHAKSLFQQLGYQAEVLSAQGDVVVLRQLLKRAPLLNCQVTLHYQNGDLVAMTEGRWLISGTETQVQTDQPTISPATALMSFISGMHKLGVVFREITLITPAYHMAASMSGEIRLNPVWYVQTDTGAYRLDLIDGELYRVG